MFGKGTARVRAAWACVSVPVATSLPMTWISLARAAAGWVKLIAKMSIPGSE
jgi:hypothetical protein